MGRHQRIAREMEQRLKATGKQPTPAELIEALDVNNCRVSRSKKEREAWIEMRKALEDKSYLEVWRVLQLLLRQEDLSPAHRAEVRLYPKPKLPSKATTICRAFLQWGDVTPNFIKDWLANEYGIKVTDGDIGQVKNAKKMPLAAYVRARNWIKAYKKGSDEAFFATLTILRKAGLVGSLFIDSARPKTKLHGANRTLIVDWREILGKFAINYALAIDWKMGKHLLKSVSSHYHTWVNENHPHWQGNWEDFTPVTDED